MRCGKESRTAQAVPPYQNELLRMRCLSLEAGWRINEDDAAPKTRLNPDGFGPRRAVGQDNILFNAVMSDSLTQLKAVQPHRCGYGDSRASHLSTARCHHQPQPVIEAAQMPEYKEILDRVVGEAKRSALPADQRLALAMDKLAVAFGLEILKIVSHRVSTEVDARLSFDNRRFHCQSQIVNRTL